MWPGTNDPWIHEQCTLDILSSSSVNVIKLVPEPEQGVNFRKYLLFCCGHFNVLTYLCVFTNKRSNMGV